MAADVAAIRTELSADVAEVRRELREDLAEVRREVRSDLHVLSDRVARIEGVLTGPWRPPNGAPPEATA